MALNCWYRPWLILQTFLLVFVLVVVVWANYTYERWMWYVFFVDYCWTGRSLFVVMMFCQFSAWKLPFQLEMNLFRFSFVFGVCSEPRTEQRLLRKWFDIWVSFIWQNPWESKSKGHCHVCVWWTEHVSYGCETCSEYIETSCPVFAELTKDYMPHFFSKTTISIVWCLPLHCIFDDKMKAKFIHCLISRDKWN